MGRLVHRRFRSVDVPESAHIGMQFEPLERDTLFGQHLCGGQPHWSGPDQGEPVARFRHVSSRVAAYIEQATKITQYGLGVPAS